MVVLIGDAHGRSERIEAFCAEFGPIEGDVLVILGDAGDQLLAERAGQGAEGTVVPAACHSANMLWIRRKT